MNRKLRVVSLVLAILSLFCWEIRVEAVDEGISSSIRFTLDREAGASPLVYYFSQPECTDGRYPILVLCEGSSGRGTLESVLFIRNYLSERIEPLHVGYLTVEKWGFDGDQIDEEAFWSHYTRSQRLEDHLRVIQHLQQHPPSGWDGQFVFIGVSEGGPLVTELSVMCPNTLATINWVGAKAWDWAEEVWQFFEHWKQNSFWVRLYEALPRWFPFSSDAPPTREEYDALFQEILRDPTPHRSMGGMTWLYHADACRQRPVDYSKIRSPFLVVKGTVESDIASCDMFVRQAEEAGVDITYFRIEGMDHWIRKRPDVIDQSFEWLKQRLGS